MVNVEIVCEFDDPPKDGVMVEEDEIYGNLTDEDLAEGERLGLTIDVDDDEDNGGF